MVNTAFHGHSTVFGAVAKLLLYYDTTYIQMQVPTENSSHVGGQIYELVIILVKTSEISSLPHRLSMVAHICVVMVTVDLVRI